MKIIPVSQEVAETEGQSPESSDSSNSHRPSETTKLEFTQTKCQQQVDQELEASSKKTGSFLQEIVDDLVSSVLDQSDSGEQL